MLAKEQAWSWSGFLLSCLPNDLQTFTEREVRLMVYTTACVLLVTWLGNLQNHEKSLRKRLTESFFGFFRSLPYVSGLVKAELEKVQKKISDDPAFTAKDGEVFSMSLPDKGLSEHEVVGRVEDMEKLLGGADWKAGRVSGVVYFNSEDLSRTLYKVYSMFAWSNPLHPDVFPSVRKMEGEVVRMVVNLYHGSAEACGCVTSGGTESILMACRAYRELAYERGIRTPEIVAPISVHSAFDKACDYFKMKLVQVPVDEVTRKVNVKAMQRAINSNTILLVGSAPQYPHGIIDDIEAIAALGKRYSLGVHVDACLGGFLIPFMEDIGVDLPPFDFRVPGVTSISADTHKYGMAPKGSSIIMYASKDLRHHQYFVAPDWQGGIYASPSVAGSRSGGMIATCWAAMMFMGRDGYVESTRQVCNASRLIAEAVRNTPGLYVFGDPKLSIVAMGSEDFDIYRLGGALSKLGWNINSLQFPPAIHIGCTVRQTEDVIKQFIEDIKTCTAEIMKTPKAKSSGMAAIYGMAQAIPDRSLVKEIAWSFLDACLHTNQ